MTFEEWFAEQDWWHKNSRREDFTRIWTQLKRQGLSDDWTADILDDVIAAMRDEYGD